MADSDHVDFATLPPSAVPEDSYSRGPELPDRARHGGDPGTVGPQDRQPQGDDSPEAEARWALRRIRLRMRMAKVCRLLDYAIAGDLPELESAVTRAAEILAGRA